MVRLTDHLDITVAVDWGIKPQTNQKKLSGTLSECPTVWIQIRLHLGPNCLQRLSADDKSLASKELNLMRSSAANILMAQVRYRPNTKSVFRVMGLKILGRVGTHIFFLKKRHT